MRIVLYFLTGGEKKAREGKGLNIWKRGMLTLGEGHVFKGILIQGIILSVISKLNRVYFKFILALKELIQVLILFYSISLMILNHSGKSTAVGNSKEQNLIAVRPGESCIW